MVPPCVLFIPPQLAGAGRQSRSLPETRCAPVKTYCGLCPDPCQTPGRRGR